VTNLLAQVAPQRSTQYAEVATALAPHELRLSPLGSRIRSLEPCQLAGQSYLRIEVTDGPDDRLAYELGALSMVSAFFEYHERLGEHAGPWLRPLETRFRPHLPQDLVMTRRYKGKTNEMFTHLLCNIARYSSAYATLPWSSLRVVDPLAGGGTTLLMALFLGADAAGVEKSARDVQTTAAFVERYARGQGIPVVRRRERLTGVGSRWWLTLGKDPKKHCVLAQGDTVCSAELLRGFKRPHVLVADLPYGIQHHGALVELLTSALPVWAGMLLPGGAMALAWDATRFPREQMIALVDAVEGLTVLNHPPYDALAHRVDRVIRRRDVLVARRAAGSATPG